MLYFAYGSNMNRDQMAVRCPGAVPIGAGTLPGYRLVERMYADIDPDPDTEVWGVLWSITPTHLHALDRYEGYPRFYTRHRVRIRTGNHHLRPAIVYEMTEAAKRERNGLPFSDHYRGICSAGAVECLLPVDPYA